MPLQRKRSWMNWDGCEPVAAWQPFGAPSFQDSLWDWRSRFISAVSVDPTWTSQSGWSFDGATQSLNTGIIPPAQSWSYLVRIANASTADAFQYIFGKAEAGSNVGFSVVETGGTHAYFNGGTVSASGTVSAGVLGVAGATAYQNGVAESGSMSAWTSASTLPLHIGAMNGVAFLYVPASDFLAAAIYDTILTPAQMWQRSQMLAHLESAEWSVWTPQRRWFFIPPPAPAVAKPVLSTIYINSADVGDTSLFDDVSGATVSASYARTGTKSFRLQTGDYLQADLTSSATKYTRFGLLVTATPASDALLVAWQETGTEHVSLYLTDKLTLQMRQGSTIIQTSPTTLTVNTWYCVEAKIVVHTTTGRFQVRIDGVDDMSAIGINTDADVDGAINEIRFEAPVDDTYIDDIVVREDQWCGTGGVYVVVPTAAGTVEEWTGAYTDVDDLPPSFTDYITATAESGVDHVFRHGELAGDYDIGLVGIFAMGRLDSAAADTVFNGLARVGTTDHTGDAQDLDTIGVYARVLMTANPDGSLAWTTHAVNNALQIGVRT